MTQNKPLISRLYLSSLMIGVGCTLAGVAAAEYEGNTEWLPASLCVLFAIFAQLSANFYRRYFIINRSLGAEPSWRIPTAPLNDRAMFTRMTSLMFFMITAIIGMGIVTMAKAWCIPVGVFILIFSYCSVGGARPIIITTPFSPIATFTVFGVFCVFVTACVQLAHDSTPNHWEDFLPAVFLAFGFGLLAINCNIVYNIHSEEHDRESGRKSFVTILGRESSLNVFLINVFLAAVSITYAAVMGGRYVPFWDIAVPVSVVILGTYTWWRLRHASVKKAYDLTFLANATVLIVGVIVLIDALLTGKPDNSHRVFF